MGVIIDYAAMQVGRYGGDGHTDAAREPLSATGLQSPGQDEDPRCSATSGVSSRRSQRKNLYLNASSPIILYGVGKSNVIHNI